jgi:hemolysin activation/secretion protein
MSLGGAYGVRAYPKGEASGDDGWLASAELFWSVPQKITKSGILKLSAFVDAGGVTVNHSPWAGAAANNQRSLFGAGVGLNWIEPGNLAVRLNYSWKLGSEQAVSDTDANGRLWLQVTKYF